MNGKTDEFNLYYRCRHGGAHRRNRWRIVSVLSKVALATALMSAVPAVAATNIVYYTDGTVEISALPNNGECIVPLLTGKLAAGLSITFENGKILDRIECYGHGKDPDWGDWEKQPMADFFFGGTLIEGHNMPEAICHVIGKLMGEGRLISAYGGIPVGLDCYPSRKPK